MLDILCGFSVGPSCFAFWELPSALTSHCSIRFLYFSYAFHFQELSPVLCPLPCLLLPDNGYCRFLLFSVFTSLFFFLLIMLVPVSHVSSSDWYSLAPHDYQRVISLHVRLWGLPERDQVGSLFLGGHPDVVISQVLCC